MDNINFNVNLDDSSDIYDLEATGWKCSICPRSKIVYNRKLDCNFQDCLREFQDVQKQMKGLKEDYGYHKNYQ